MSVSLKVHITCLYVQIQGSKSDLNLVSLSPPPVSTSHPDHSHSVMLKINVEVRFFFPLDQPVYKEESLEIMLC